MVATAELQITWEPLPDDYDLPDDPVDNLYQPALAAALTDSLQVAGRLSETTLTPSNYGICATVNGKLVIKAPDWAFVPNIRVPRSDIARSYTPQLQGDIPVIVVEFLSDTDGKEYSSKPTYPPGKWFFYEQVLKVPNYAIFNPDTGNLELYRLDVAGNYQLQPANDAGRHWIEEMGSFLGVWEGTRESRSGFWLRWWNEEDNLLLWSIERAERLAAQLRAAGIEPEV
ncbi:Uma2 family endonuclease [Geitlerinema sp. CS-897]|nr:Uma2 family endonuclease [Geitlerinema sp. CS-897]